MRTLTLLHDSWSGGSVDTAATVVAIGIAAEDRDELQAVLSRLGVTSSFRDTADGAADDVAGADMVLVGDLATGRTLKPSLGDVPMALYTSDIGRKVEEAAWAQGAKMIVAGDEVALGRFVEANSPRPAEDPPAEAMAGDAGGKWWRRHRHHHPVAS